MAKCLICQEREATKKNSHIIPSFLVAMVTSYDGSYKRDKEILFLIKNFNTKIYTGNLPSTEYDRLFDDLTEERIENELKINTAAQDYIFCPKCESDLSQYLEAPYASCLNGNKKIANEIPLIFWISVIWRMSVTGNSGFKLSIDTEEKLRNIIHSYFEHQIFGSKFSITDITINYRILHCKDYCRKKAGYIYAEYHEEDDLLTMTIGDLVICCIFSSDVLPSHYTYFGLEKYLKTAPINRGQGAEQRVNISEDEYTKSIKHFIHFAVDKKKKDEFKKLDTIWKELNLFGQMPMKMKITFLLMLYDDTVKLGDKHTTSRYIQIFYYLLKNIDAWFLKTVL